MNVFNKVTLQALKKNKTRTIVTIIGIILSAAMICAVTTFVYSIQNYLMGYAIYNDGDWHGSAERVDHETYLEIGSDDAVSKITYNHILGYAKIDSINEFKPYLYVIGADNTSYFDMLPVHLLSGRLPINQNEILIPEHALTNGGMSYKVGDTITLEIGDRMLDGFVMTQYNPCYEWNSELMDDVFNGEIIEVRETRTYTIVGFYERPSFEDITAPGYTAITVSDIDFDASAQFDVYFKMKKPSNVYAFMQEREINGSENTDVLMFSGISKYNGFTAILTGMATVVICLIMFGSISLIYNAFAISVSERTKQFGLLSSVGATKKQLRRMVLFEALTVSAIGIPLGILAGIGGIGVTLLIIGDKFSSMMASYDAPMRICVSWEAVVVAAIVALVTVLLSAWIPSKRATRISAVEAIRQNADIKVKNKPVKTSKLTYKLFGLPGVLASKHYKRNKKKYRATVISLFMSIVLFVSASAFADYLMGTVTSGMGTNEYDVVYIAHDDDLTDLTADKLLDLLMVGDGVTHGAYIERRHFFGSVSQEQLNEEFVSILGPQQDQPEGYSEVTGYVVFVNDKEFDRLLEQHKLSKADYYDPVNPLAVALDRNLTFDVQKEKYVLVDALKGDSCQITCQVVKDIEGYTRTGRENIDGEDYLIYENPEDGTDILQIPIAEAYRDYQLNAGTTITEYPFFMDKSSTGSIYMLYPMSMYEHVYPSEMKKDRSFTYYFQSDDHTQTVTSMETILLDNGMDSGNLSDIAADEESTRNIISIMQVFSYGFIVLISLIAAANVFNTISTNISLRRREFAMLKSVGMTQQGFNKMMNYECLLYGSKALLLGLPVSAVVTWFIWQAASDGIETTFRLPWGAIGIAVLSVFLVVFATMVYSMSKIKKENPIDALKNENL